MSLDKLLLENWYCSWSISERATRWATKVAVPLFSGLILSLRSQLWRSTSPTAFYGKRNKVTGVCVTIGKTLFCRAVSVFQRCFFDKRELELCSISLFKKDFLSLSLLQWIPQLSGYFLLMHLISAIVRRSDFAVSVNFTLSFMKAYCTW